MAIPSWIREKVDALSQLMQCEHGERSLVSFTMGTVYQKPFCPTLDLRSDSVIQFIGALALVGPFALLLEDNRVEWTSTCILSLGWLMFGETFADLALVGTVMTVVAVALVNAPAQK